MIVSLVANRRQFQCVFPRTTLRRLGQATGTGVVWL